MKLGDEQYYYSPHSLLLTEPEFYHDEEHYEATDVLYIGFTYDDTTVPLKNGLFFDDSSHLLLHLLERMKQVMIAQRPHYILQLNLLAGEIIIELSRLKYSAAKPKLWENKLIYAVKAIEENYIHPIDLHSLASLSGYSFERFRHIFKEETGYSPVQYIMSKRFAHAKQMLETSATHLLDRFRKRIFYRIPILQIVQRALRLHPAGISQAKGLRQGRSPICVFTNRAQGRCSRSRFAAKSN
ncbi:helix-turn-helix domain-containing protein [Paenibacillus cymbidii]|nr:AraC family transcriptional regulator [Paenibacillus cymbidii]